MNSNKHQYTNGRDALTDQIEQGIAKNGIYILDGGNLDPILKQNGHAQSEDEKRRTIEDFARSHEFSVHLGSSLRIAIFQKSR